MLAVEMLPAGHGDALRVEYGTTADPHQLLIDAGTFHTWGVVREELLRRHRDRYEIFVMTHVDEDHLGGAIALLDDPDLRRRVDRVWFNGYIHCRAGGNVLGPVNGEEITERLVRGSGLHWNTGFTPAMSDAIGGPVVVPSRGDLPVVPLPGGARVILLSPTGPALKALAKIWVELVTNAHLVPAAGSRGHTTSPKPRTKKFPALPDPLDQEAIAALAAKKAVDRSAANATSIAFILEYGGKRVLFAADAHAPVLAAALGRYAERVGETRPRFDLVKMAHHGSNANISMDLLAFIDCQRFLISTNGDNFAHPDDAAIAKVITAADRPVTFYCNYRTPRLVPWAERGPGVGASFTFPDADQRSLRVTV